MSFDDRLRRHLHDVGDGLDLASGALTGVQARAKQRARRQQTIVGAMGVTSIIAIVGLSVVLLRSGQGSESEVFALGDVEVTTPEVTVSPSATLQASAETIPVASEPESSVERAPATGAEQSRESAAVPEEDPEAGSSELLIAATSTTDASPHNPWTLVQGPAAGAFVDYGFAGRALVARTTAEWFIDRGDGWELLAPPPADIVSIAFTVDANGRLLVVGNRDDGPCVRQQVVASEADGEWDVEVVAEAKMGVVSTLLDAEVRSTDSVAAVAGLREHRIQIECLLDGASLPTTGASLVDSIVSYTDEEGATQTVALEDLEVAPEVLALLDGPRRERWLASWASISGDGSWVTGSGDSWSVENEAPLERTDELAVVGPRVVVVAHDGSNVSALGGELPSEMAGATVRGFAARDGELLAWGDTGSWTSWDGHSAPLKREAPVVIPPEGWLVDAVEGPEGWIVVHSDGAETWLRTPIGDTALAAVSGKKVLWATLGEITDEIRLIAESPVGPAVFGFSGR